MDTEIDPNSRFLTTTKESYNSDHVKALKAKENNKYSKFRTLQLSGSAIVGNEVRGNEVQETDDLTQPFNKTEGFQTLESQPSSQTLARTGTKLLHTSDAPIAMGRSGLRLENGLNTSGLLGERLILEEDPKRNTLAQRTWLYAEDAALAYKINGVPESRGSENLSLSLNESQPFQGWNYGRRAILTGDYITKSGAKRYGVFLDEKDAVL